MSETTEDDINEPQDDDLITTDWRTYRIVGKNDRIAFIVVWGDKLSEEYEAYCKTTNVYPTLWFQNERGSLDIIDPQTESFIE